MPHQDSAKPQVLILSDNMIAGGMERQVVELLKGLKRLGSFCTILGVFDQGGSREGEAKKIVDIYLSLPRRARFDILPAFKLFRQMKSLDVRLIHSYGWMSGMAGLAAARLYHIPIINGGFREAPSKLSVKAKINRWCALHSTMMVSNSQASLKAYGIFGHPRTKVIYNGLDFTRFSNVTPEQYGEKAICMVANFSPFKDHRSMIDAFALVLQQVPDARLILVGHDMGTLNDIKELVAGMRLENCVTFVTNSIHPEAIIAGCQVGVLSTYGESFSNALLEYMFLAKPVITNDSDGTRELVHDGTDGILVPIQSPKALAEAIAYILSQPELARKMGQAGYVYVRERFLLDRMVNEYEKLYNNVLSYGTA